MKILEAPLRIELRNKGFADLCLTAWLWRHVNNYMQNQKNMNIYRVPTKNLHMHNILYQHFQKCK